MKSTPWAAWLLLLGPTPAFAQFDLVGLYQHRVKGFEAVYYLEADERWARDRRVFELFGTLNVLQRDPEEERFGEALFHVNAGLLLNLRPKDGPVQLTLFSMANQLRFRVNDITEMLHGARVTVEDLLEVTLGGYWLLENTRQSFGTGQASVYFELGFPFLHARSSYVIGPRLDRGAEDALLRFDTRFSYEQLRFVDDIGFELTRFDLSDAENLLATVGFVRLGTDAFRFLTADASWSLSEGRLAHARAGLDLLAQLDEDFNATRRGHFGTNFRLEAYATFASPLAYRRFRPRIAFANASEGRAGFTVEGSAQIPAKWFFTTLLVVASAGAASLEPNERTRQRYLDTAVQVTADTIEHPEDELFVRLTMTYAYNDPAVLEMFPEYSDQHRIYFTMGIMY